MDKMSIEYFRALYSEKNSFCYWFPRVAHLVPTPRSIIVPFEKEKYSIYNMFEDASVFDSFVKKLVKIIWVNNFRYPVFMRTDYFSGKHHFKQTCFVEGPEKLKLNLLRLLDESLAVSLFGLPVNAIIIREYVELDWKFKAFMGLPIAPERRYFIRDGKVQCHHPYWPEDAIKFWEKGYVPPEDWRERLYQMNIEHPREVKLLSSYAAKIAKKMDGYWSVDFAKTKTGKWLLIDMGLGEVSWHPKTCRYQK